MMRIAGVDVILHLQQTIKDLFEEPSGLESLAKEDAKDECRPVERARDVAASSSSSSVADASGTETVLNDDLMEQVKYYHSEIQ